ncbi:MAG: MFS transporter [Clostridiales bacterium]|nr:MFS transporter [Clostridiales bacterium]
MSIIGPVFPLIAEDFKISITWDAWTVTAYTAIYAVGTVLAGALGDRLGHRRLFAWGLVLFGLGSAVAALAPSFGVFLLGRALQGGGAGAIFPNAQAAGIQAFPPERRGTALGIFGAVFGVAAIIGPNLGGFLGQYWGWPAIFWINVPLVLLVLLLVPSLPPTALRPRGVPDLWGGILFGLTLVALLLSLTAWDAYGAELLLAGLLLGLLFAWRQGHPGGKEPFLDLKAFASLWGAMVVAGAILVGMDMAAAVFIPTLAQKALGVGVLASGVSVMPAALTAAVFSALGGVLVDRRGSRFVLVAGLLSAALGALLLVPPHLTWLRFIAAISLMGIGTAFTMGAPLNRMALALFPGDRSGEALSLIAVFRTVGIAMGPVLFGLALELKGFPGLFSLVAAISLLGALLFAGLKGEEPAPSP